MKWQINDLRNLQTLKQKTIVAAYILSSADKSGMISTTQVEMRNMNQSVVIPTLWDVYWALPSRWHRTSRFPASWCSGRTTCGCVWPAARLPGSRRTPACRLPPVQRPPWWSNRLQSWKRSTVTLKLPLLRLERN